MSSTVDLTDEDYKRFFNTIIEQTAPDATPVSELARRKYEDMLPSTLEPELQIPLLPTVEKPITAPSANPLIHRRKSALQPKELQKLLSEKVYEDAFMEALPMCDFYLPGTRIMYRDLLVKEIENYSTMDEGSLFDFKEKLQDILENSTLFIHPDGTYGTVADIKEGDKAWMIYLVREKTFGKGRHQKGQILTVDVQVGDEVFPIEICTDNIEIYRNEEIMQWHNPELACFVFETELQPEPLYVAPPTVGLKNCFDQYLRIKLKTQTPHEVNKQFFRIAPFLQPHVNYISYDELVEFEAWFTTEMTPDTFSFLYDLFENHMLIGIRGLKKNVGTTVVRRNNVYPTSFKSIYVLPNAFRIFCKK